MAEHDKLAQRLGMILQLLNNGEALDVKILAKEFHVTIRTIQKDLNERLSFLPLFKENGHYILESYALGKLSYDDILRFASFTGICDLFPELNKNMIVDVLNEVTQKTMKVKGIRYEKLRGHIDMFNTVGGAILSHRRLSFFYHEKLRSLEPYRMVNTDGSWYLIGLENDVLKHFSFGKIKQLSDTEDVFEPDASIERIIEDDETLWYTQKPIEVVLCIDKKVSAYFLRKEILPSQKILEINDTHTVISCKVAFREHIFRTVRYWIPHIVIVEPKEYQAILEEELQSYLHLKSFYLNQ